MELEVFFKENKKVNARLNGYIIPTDQPRRSGGDEISSGKYSWE